MNRLYWNSGAILLAAITQFLYAQSSEEPPALPLPAHVVIVMEENHSYSEIIGSSQAAYINTLASEGALFTNSYGVAHPSEPNYLAIFSGSTQGVTSDQCPLTFSTANLGYELIAHGKTFTGYSEVALGGLEGLHLRRVCPQTCAVDGFFGFVVNGEPAFHSLSRQLRQSAEGFVCHSRSAP